MTVNQPSEPNRRSKRRGALAAGGSAHFFHDGLTDCQFVLLPLWAEAFGLSYAQIGLVKLCSSGALATFQIPAGFLAEKFGSRLVLPLGTLVAGSGLVLAGYADTYGALLMGILVLGLGASVQHPLASALISSAFQGGPVRAALGTYNFLGDLGKVAVPLAFAGMIALWGWRESTFVYGSVVMGFAVLLFVMMGIFALAPAISRTQTTPVRGWGIRNKHGFSLLSAISMIDSSCRMAFLTFVPFLLLQKGIEGASIGFALSLVFAGGATGKLVCGLFADRIGIYRTVVITELATGVCIFAIVALPLNYIWFVLPLAGVALNGTSSVLYGSVVDLIEPDRLPRAYGLFYTLGSGVSAAAPLLYGLLSDHSGVGYTLVVIGLSAFLTLPLCYFLKRSVGN